MNLSQEQQELLNTDFGDFEKEAEARLEVVQEMYAYGHNKIAHDIASNIEELIKQAEEDEEKEEKEDKKEEMDEESEKAAAEMGAFIERGVFDGLCKLGQENHQDPTFYLLPFIEEKVAKAGGFAAVKQFAKDAPTWGKLYAEEGGKQLRRAGKAIKEKGTAAAKKVSEGVKQDVATLRGKHYGGDVIKGKARATLAPVSPKERAIAGAKLVGKAAVPTAATYGTYRALKGKKKED